MVSSTSVAPVSCTVSIPRYTRCYVATHKQELRQCRANSEAGSALNTDAVCRMQLMSSPSSRDVVAGRRASPEGHPR